MAATALGGCSVSKTVKLDSAEPEISTASINEPIKGEGIDSTDAELIRSVVAANLNVEPSTSILGWSNPDTGNRGTITAINGYVGNEGQNCKKFRTTVDSFTGISLYTGEACQATEGSWVLSSLYRD